MAGDVELGDDTDAPQPCLLYHFAHMRGCVHVGRFECTCAPTQTLSWENVVTQKNLASLLHDTKISIKMLYDARRLNENDKEKPQKPAA